MARGSSHSSEDALINLKGPDLQIRHLSGEPVDTADIELRFSWSHEIINADTNLIEQCDHYSTYSAEKKGDQIELGGITRPQPMYMKTSSGDYYFGDLVLTPGLKVFATSDYLGSAIQFTTATESEKIVGSTGNPCMDFIFDPNGKITSETFFAEGEEEKCLPDPNAPYGPDESGCCTVCGYYLEDGEYEIVEGEGIYTPCDCLLCYTPYDVYNPMIKGGIMEHLKKGTEVKVIILHKPSDTIIYDKTVMVQ